MIEKDVYDGVIKTVSKQIAEKILSNETNLPKRATSIDGDIAEIVREIGLQSTQIVLETVRDQIISEKKTKEKG